MKEIHKNYKEQEVCYVELKQVEPARFANFASLANNVSPLISSNIYSLLPDAIRDLTSKFSKPREKDMFFTGFLGIMSGCLGNFYSNYQGAKVNSNLYMFISAPAGSGKGKLNHLRDLFQPYHDYVKEKHKNNGTLFIPGNTTSSMLLSHLKDSNASGIIFETEADSLSVALKGEHGNFSHILRNAFHHEFVSISRVGDNQFDELKNPQISVVLSGTPEQICRFIPNSEDGLFSRFNFYHFNEKSTWNPLMYDEVNGTSLDSYFIDKSKILFELLVSFAEKSDAVNFRLTEEQLILFNTHYTNLYEKYNCGEENLNDLINRNGLKTIRIAMILSFFRQFEKIMNSQEVFCDQKDYEIALEVSDIYFNHNLSVFKGIMPKRSSKVRVEDAFLVNLSDEFRRDEAIKIGANLGLSQRTVDNRLSNYFNTGKLSKSKAGFYVKN